jgi:hypothetical protein
MRLEVYDIAGLAGTGLYVATYFANQQRWLHAYDWRYPLANLAAALLILVSLCYAWNFPSAILELFWAAISVWGFVLSLRERRRRRH